MKKSLHITGIIGLTLIAAVGVAAPEPLVVAPAESEARNPRIDSEDIATAISWIARTEDGDEALRTMVVKDARLTRLPSPRTLTSAPAGMIGDHDVALHPRDLQPGSVWVEFSEEGSVIYYAQGRSQPEVVTATTTLLELPTIEFDDEGYVYIAWTEVSGGQSLIHGARRLMDGTWVSTRMSNTERPYDVLPRLFGNDVGAELYWFSMEENAVVARMAMLSPGTRGTESLSTLGEMPANRLPILYRAGDAGLGAIWVEQRESGEIYFDLDPRTDTGGEPRRIGREGWRISQPTVSRDNNAVLSWVEESNNQNIIVAESPFGETMRLPVSITARNPAVAVSSNWLHLVYIDESADAAGSLYYWRGQ